VQVVKPQNKLSVPAYPARSWSRGWSAGISARINRSIRHLSFDSDGRSGAIGGDQSPLIHQPRTVRRGSTLGRLHPSSCEVASPRALHHVKIEGPKSDVGLDMLSAIDGDAGLQIVRKGPFVGRIGKAPGRDPLQSVFKGGVWSCYL